MSVAIGEKPTTEIENASTGDVISATKTHGTENFGVFGKPNAIVRPVRRNEISEEMSQVQLQLETMAEQQWQQQIQSQRHYHHQQQIRHNTENQIGNFNQELDFKLKTLQKNKKHSSKNVIF